MHSIFRIAHNLQPQFHRFRVFSLALGHHCKVALRLRTNFRR